MEQLTVEILVIEDDTQIRKFITYALEKDGYKVFSAANAQNGLSFLVAEHIGLLILDLGLPDFDGTEVIKKVRTWSDIPIIVVSARDQDREKVNALDLGADDYLTKPFSANELLARIRVALRHVKRSEVSTVIPLVYSVKEISVELDKRLVYVRGEEIHLTPTEYNMLVLFLKNAGKVLTTGYLLKEIWGQNYGSDTQALRALMASLRRKIEITPARPQYIITEVGVGYRMVDE